MLDSFKTSSNISTEYIILFWIIALIVFTFYCLFRLWYLSFPAKNKSSSSVDKFNSVLKATNSNQANIIQYIDNLLEKDKITDIPACSSVFDDNYGVRALGYRSCNDAYSDYLVKRLDINAKYGESKSVAEYCPITTKSSLYMKCMATLLNKYNSSANMLQGLTNDVSNSVNQRLKDRSDVLNNIQININPQNNKELQDFENESGLTGSINRNSNDILFDASRYFQNKYGSSVDIFTNIQSNKTITEKFTNSNDKQSVDPYIVSNFFGNYIPVKGQFLAFNNLSISLDFDKPILESTPTNTDTNTEINSRSDEIKRLTNTGKVFLKIIDNNANVKIKYEIGNINYYDNRKNTIMLDIIKKTIEEVQSSEYQNLQQLLTLLGISIPTRLFIKLEKTISDMGIERFTYTLMNLNMDTIIIMKKIN